MESKKVVTSFLIYKNKILIMKRSNKVGSFQGKWAVASGYLEQEDAKPLERAMIEVAEETGINTLKIIKEGKSFDFHDEEHNVHWIIYPFLFKVDTDKVNLDWEHDDFKWIKPSELEKYDIVKNLEKGLQRVLKF